MTRQPTVSNEEECEVWEAYRAGHPNGVAVLLANSPCMILLDPLLTPRASPSMGTSTPRPCWRLGLSTLPTAPGVLHRYIDGRPRSPERWAVAIAMVTPT